MNAQIIELHVSEIRDFCQRYHVCELAVFGSYANGDFGRDSDIDLLVEFAAGTEVGFLTLARMGRELSELLRKPVDLIPKAGLKPRIRQQVLDSRKVLYAA